MSDNKTDGRGEHRRPLLANGERLKHDATRPRGGGKKFHPVSVSEAWNALAPLAQALFTGLDTLPTGTVGRHVVFEATMRPNYLAPSYFPSGVLSDGLYVVGARTSVGPKITETKVEENQPTRRILVAGAPAAVKRFANRMASAPSATNANDWEELRRFSDVSLPRKESVIVRRPSGDGAASVTFEAVVTQVGDRYENLTTWADQHFARFVAWVRACGGTVDQDYRRDLGRLTFVPVLAPIYVLDRIAQFNLLRAIRPMPEIAPFPGDMLRAVGAIPRLSEAALDGERPQGVVAVFDGGVDPSLSVFAPFVSTFDLTSEPPGQLEMRHGSMVTSALLYGSVIPGEQLPNPTTTIDHYRVFPLPPLQPGMPDHRLYQMLDRIVPTLEQKPYPIVVLAIGPNDAVDDTAEPDRFTAELDSLAHAHDITFVCAVGNNGRLDSALGYDRVQPPGDAVNAIGVGAITRSARDPKKRWVRAPYSARGPGREGQRVQPMVVEFGGSDAEQLVGFDERGRIFRWVGTSFAAPTVARTIAGLGAALTSARHTPDIFRAFTTHMAERGHGHGKKFLDLGFGRAPASFNAAFDCPPNEVTVLYEDRLPRDQVVAMRFPFPAGLPAATRLELTWTISFVSEIDPRDATDYTLSGIDTVFRPDERVRFLTNPLTKESEQVRKDFDLARITSSLARGFRLSEEPKAHAGWMLTKGEQGLRRDGKWETIIPGRAILTAGELHEPRLDLQHLRREDGQLVRGDGVRPLRFAMLLTIKAAPGVVLYDLVASQYRVLTPLVRVPVRLSGVA